MSKHSKGAGFLSAVFRKSPQTFVLLDRDTDGRSGRAIYIDEKLLVRFAGASQSQANLAMHRLKQLRALAANGANQQSNLSDAFEHRGTLGSTYIKYKLLTDVSRESGSVPGVYITDIEIAGFLDLEPGLYNVQKKGYEWQLNSKRLKAINTDYAAVNGLCDSAEQAAQSILPEFVKKAYENKKWEGNLGPNGFTMFFNPPELYSRKTKWRSSRQKSLSKKYAANMLASAMLSSQNDRKAVYWVVHGDGAQLFNTALERLKGKTLDHHTVLFLAPTEDVSKILPKMRDANIKLHDDVMKIHDDDYKSRSIQMTRFKSLQTELSSFSGFEDKAVLLGRQAKSDLQSSVSMTVGAITGGLGVGAFLLAPALPAIGGVASAALGAYATWQKYNSLRNMASTNSTNLGLNPHMHPFKSKEEMNLHAAKYSGGSMRTFVALLKDFVK